MKDWDVHGLFQNAGGVMSMFLELLNARRLCSDQDGDLVRGEKR